MKYWTVSLFLLRAKTRWSKQNNNCWYRAGNRYEGTEYTTKKKKKEKKEEEKRVSL